MAEYPDVYSTLTFVETCNGIDIEAEIEDLKDRVEDLEDIVGNPQEVYI